MICGKYASYTAKMAATVSAEKESHVIGEYVYSHTREYRRGIR